MEAWDDYDFRKKSDNDRPGGWSLTTTNTHALSPPLPHTTDVFPEKQLYVVYAAEDSGMQLGSYVVSKHSLDGVTSTTLLLQPIPSPL